jgi:tetratricopeptide (TPR) repeat protein
MSSEQAQIRQIDDAADKLRDEWMTIMMPGAKLRRGEYERAIVAFSEWVILEGESPWPMSLPYLGRGVAYLRLGQFDRAQSDFRKAGQIDARILPTALAFSGHAHDLQGNEKAALSAFSASTKLDRSNPLTRLYRSRIFARKGKHKLAVAELRVAVQRMPKHVQANRAMAWLLSTAPNRNVRNGRKAVAYATTACEGTDWEDWQCLDTLAAAYAESGDFVKAVKWVQKAIAIARDEERLKLESRLELYKTEQPYRTK